MKSKTTTKRKPMRSGGSAGQMNRQRRNSATSGDEPRRGGRKLSRAEETRKAESPPIKPVKRQKMQAGGQMNQERRNSATPGGAPTRPRSVSGGQMDRGTKSGPTAAVAAARRGNAESNAAQRRSDVAAKRLEDAVSVQRTGGGNYGTYQRGSQTAQSFRDAYASAKRAGKDTFTWRNRRYTTE